jgi:hypothetical protein
MNCKILGHGKFNDKKTGMNIPDTFVKPVSLFKNKSLKDTFLWGKNLFYMDALEKGKFQQDSNLSYIFYVKNINFKSMYEFIAPAPPDHEYSMVGYSSYYFDTKALLTGKLEDMRKLTKEEEKICERMIQKLKNYKPSELKME